MESPRERCHFTTTLSSTGCAWQVYATYDRVKVMAAADAVLTCTVPHNKGHWATAHLTFTPRTLEDMRPFAQPTCRSRRTSRVRHPLVDELAEHRQRAAHCIERRLQVELDIGGNTTAHLLAEPN